MAGVQKKKKKLHIGGRCHAHVCFVAFCVCFFCTGRGGEQLATASQDYADAPDPSDTPAAASRGKGKKQEQSKTKNSWSCHHSYKAPSARRHLQESSGRTKRKRGLGVKKTLKYVKEREEKITIFAASEGKLQSFSCGSAAWLQVFFREETVDQAKSVCAGGQREKKKENLHLKDAKHVQAMRCDLMGERGGS